MTATTSQPETTTMNPSDDLTSGQPQDRSFAHHPVGQRQPDAPLKAEEEEGEQEEEEKERRVEPARPPPPPPSLPEIPSLDNDDFDFSSFMTPSAVQEGKVNKRASNVMKLAQENEKLKAELKAMTDRIEAAERRRALLAAKEGRTQAESP